MYSRIKVLVISSIVLLLVVSMGVAVQDSQSEREAMGFTGQVRRVIETKHYRYNQTEFTTQVEWLFDKAGYLIKQIETDDNGLVIGHIEMLYEDEKPLKVRRKSNDGIISEIKYSYDQDGNLVEYTESENHVLQSITKHTIDNHGKLVAVSEFDSTGTLLEQKDYHYNEQGLLSAVSSIYDTVNGTYEYDQAGKLIKQLTKQKDGASAEYIFENTSGKQALKGLTLTQSDHTVNKRSLRDGLVVEASTSYPDSRYYKIVYSYNEQCDPICETHYANDSPEPINTSHYEYVYDNVGNWVKKRLILDNKEETEDSPTFIYKLTRSIGYFD